MVHKKTDKEEPNHKQSWLYRFLRGAIRVFTKKMDTIWEEPFEGKPSVFVCNHDRAFGPIAMCAHFELSEDVRPWINAQVLSSKESPEYIRQDYWWNQDKWYSPILSHTLVYIYALIVPPILRGADCVPVYHNTEVVDTLRRSIKTLSAGKHLLLFPEHPVGFREYGEKIFDGFVSIGRLYYGRKKETVNFYPTYVNWNEKKIYVGKPITYDPSIKYPEQVARTTASVEAFFDRFKEQ